MQDLFLQGVNPKFPTCERQKIEKTYTKEKQSHAQDSVYVVRQFAYLHGVAGISLLSGKKYKVWQYSISVSREQRQYKTLITKKTILHYVHKIHNGLQNGSKNFPGGVALEPLRGLSMSTLAWACQPKPPLHGLNLKKYLIKNHATLFGSGCQPDQT